jgi:error-prone DNA polymerase
MASVISNEGGFYPTFAYVSEARRMGLDILPPDINLSDWAYTAAGKTVCVGLMQIKGLERCWIDRMLANRNASGPFKSLDDFWPRTQPKLDQARMLIKAGCFDSIAQGRTRPGLLWRAYSLASEKRPSDLPNPDDYSEEQKLRHEIEILGFPLSCHPLEIYGFKLKAVKYVPARKIVSYIGQSITMIGWLINEKMTQTIKGDPMGFVTFEDTTGLYEATFFPRTYRRFFHLLAGNRPYLLRGRVEEDFGAVTLNVQSIERLDMPSGNAMLN